ncbi:hypothetical protein KKA95_01720 [Patescibacteria group bacterium]|nr:hypothetical protein [Patescibacteria group bacterium]
MTPSNKKTLQQAIDDLEKVSARCSSRADRKLAQGDVGVIFTVCDLVTANIDTISGNEISQVRVVVSFLIGNAGYNKPDITTEEREALESLRERLTAAYGLRVISNGQAREA